MTRRNVLDLIVTVNKARREIKKIEEETGTYICSKMPADYIQVSDLKAVADAVGAEVEFRELDYPDDTYKVEASFYFGDEKFLQVYKTKEDYYNGGQI